MAAFPTALGYQTRIYPNTVKGIRKFIGLRSVTEHHCVMEATGNYGFLLLYLLEKQGIAASMVNPKQIKHFSRMMMSVTKTDTKDACMIAMYGEKMIPAVYKMPSETIMLLKQKKNDYQTVEETAYSKQEPKKLPCCTPTPRQKWNESTG